MSVSSHLMFCVSLGKGRACGELLAHFGKEGAPETLIANISQGTLAEMVGTTRSRVSFFMTRFRKLGFIDYHGGNDLQVHGSLLNLVLRD